ncbi:serine/threonine protein phosphatase (plasmid) [Clostridium botulinum A2B3 87]|uniref:metallophosphoesterase family protein n=1 Tax=Clostridium botulinum TaxID=1491 RepID=UPI0004A58FD9|nr:metallophosphoesterase family protein [Clostridium botulinum]KEI95128.1 serine/threonine protein phosphatase [Clostridium botulinum A2B3 87]
MSKYVMSDLHGCYNKFIKMLDQIKFKNDDELYILGDILDRGKNPLGILDYIILHKNITLLKGNHEQMYIDFYENNDISLWYYNGGEITHSQIVTKEIGYDKSLYNYFRKLPYIKVIDKFILVHAGLSFSDNCNYLSIDDFIKYQDEDTCLWNRENIGKEQKYRDYTVICGHTPVQSITNNYDDVRILKRYGTIYIDCGCVFEKANGKVACIRLDDMAEFYIK